ncbi:MAG: hypothetical protein J6O40_04590 [Ruminococcus sp.]|nr:hypothetical protein [Ruminococcus sp.]
MNKRMISAMIAGLSLALCLASCGDSDSSTRDASSTPDTAVSKADGQSEGNNDTVSADDNESRAAESIEYDVNGDKRLFDDLKAQYDGNYKLTGNLTMNEGDPYPVQYEVKGELRFLSVTVMGMQTKRYITAEGDLYVVNDGTTTYEKYNHDELGNMVLKSPQYDPLFAATGDFKKAEETDTTIIEEYALDYEGLEGSVIYTFDKSTGKLSGVSVESEDMENELVTDIAISPAEDADFVLPDLSAYVMNN